MAAAPPVTSALIIAVALSTAPVRIAVAPLAGHNMRTAALDDLSVRLGAAFEAEGFITTSPATTAAALGSDTKALTDAQVPQLARTLAVEFVALGKVTRQGRMHTLKVRVLSGTDGTVVASHTRSVRSMSGMQRELQRAARLINAALRPADKPALVEVAEGEEALEEGESTVRDFAWLPALGGIALAGSGSYFLLQTQDAADELSKRRLSDERAADVAAYGRQSETLMFGSFMLAGGALASAAAMYFLSRDEEGEEDEGDAVTVTLSVAVGPTAHGGVAGIRWSLP